MPHRVGGGDMYEPYNGQLERSRPRFIIADGISSRSNTGTTRPPLALPSGRRNAFHRRSPTDVPIRGPRTGPRKRTIDRRHPLRRAQPEVTSRAPLDRGWTTVIFGYRWSPASVQWRCLSSCHTLVDNSDCQFHAGVPVMIQNLINRDRDSL
jgi:hypothetical protein